MIHLARFHSGYGFGHPASFGGYGYHHGYGSYGGGWISHMVISSVVHAMIYSVIFRVMRQLSLGEAVLLAVVVLVVLYSWNRNRGYRRW